MLGRFNVAASVWFGVVTCLASPLAVHAQDAADSQAPALAVATPGEPGTINGIVRNEQGIPIVGAVVSALGATMSFALTDAFGHYEISTLTPGPYLLRVYSRGYTSPRTQMIEVRSNVRLASSFAMRRADERLQILAAGIGPSGAANEAPPTPSEPAVASGTSTAETVTTPGDRDETAWRVRHARRSILKESTSPVPLADSEGPDERVGVDLLEQLIGSPARAAASFLTETPFSGQVNFLTTSAFDSPEELFSGNNLARGVAYLSVGAPAGDHADWTVRGAITEGDLTSWNLAGAYKTREGPRHRHDVGMSYSTQRYGGGNPLTLRDVRDGSRNAGTVYGYDAFALTPSLSIGYGAKYSHYDYLERGGLLSPRVEVAVRPGGDFRLAASLSSRADAPGAEAFLPPGAGIWLPPERTFSSIAPGRSMQAERTTQVAVEVERGFGPAAVSIRGFRQQVDNQLLTVFGVDNPAFPGAKLGHYMVGNAGDAEATGATVALRSTAAGRFHGSIAYTTSNAQVMPGNDLGYVIVVGSGPALAGRLQDLTTSIDAEVPETSTRVIILYRVGNGYVRPAAPGDSQFGLDSRFDLQVRQALPFMNFMNARWEMLIAVRNFFRDIESDQSVYDELLTVKAPKRIVGGVTLHF